jgi:NAD(P)-dependent dehydrogenase (short-subunit alcohol dehydrogenase family)
MSGRLSGKVAIVTGAGAGIGEAIAKKFAMEGASVVVNGLPGDPIDDVVRWIQQKGGQAVAFAGDVSETLPAILCVRTAIETYKQLDILVNNAGTLAHMAETHEYDIDDFDTIIRNNIRSVFNMTKSALPMLHITRGCVISAGSEAGLNGQPKDTPYGGTKAWIHAFMMGVAVEQAKYGVRANCVCPGPIDTEMTRKETGPMDKQTEELTINATPMARRGTPEEVANVYAFLASDEASYVTGALWLVDGGITVAKGPIGQQTPKELRKPPEGTLEMQHAVEPNRFSE